MLQSQATTVAELLGETRRMARLTTRQMAAEVGVSQATVSKWERGQGEPSVSQFILWARATKQPADRLVDGLFDSVCAPWDSNPEPID